MSAFIKWLKEMHDTAVANAGYERYMQDTVHDWQEAETPRALLVRLLFRFYIVNLLQLVYWEALRAFWCERFGHDLEDTGSWGGPESGGEDFTCRRCKAHFHHVYY